MARSFTLLLLTVLVTALPARAQIIITHADYEAALGIEGTNSLYQTGTSAALAALAAQTGANQTWDFRGLPYEAAYVTTVTRVQPPVPGSDDSHFASATYIFRVQSDDSTAYTYQTLGPAKATFLGLASTSSVIRFLPEQTSAVLPLTFGTTWTSNYETQFEPSPLPGITMTTQESNAVVGWGTLVTPAGSTEALMIRTETTTTVSFPLLPPTITTSAQVLFTAYGRLNANIYLDSSGPVSGDYNVYNTSVAAEPSDEIGSAAHLDVIGPNPLHPGDPVQLTFSLPTAASARLDVFDALGRHVAILLDGAAQTVGPHQVIWTPGSLASGIYFVRLTANAETASRCLTLTR